MPNETNLPVDEEIREINLRISRLKEEIAENYKIASEFQKEANRLSTKNERRIEKLSRSSKRHDKQIGDYGNKFGEFTESLAEPSIRRILDERFDADYEKRLKIDWSKQIGTLEIDAWGVARNGVEAVYLVEIKSRFRPEYIAQVLRQVGKFRKYVHEYRHYAIFPIVATVRISDADRRRVWKAGMYLIDIADGVFKLAESPERFNPKGDYGLNVVKKAIPPLHLVRNANSDWRKVN